MGSFTESTVVHTEINDSNNVRTWVLDNHTASKVQLINQKRRTTGPVDDQKLESELKVVYGTEDAAGDILPTKISIACNTRYPIDAKSTDLDAAITEFQLLVASTKFADMVKKSLYYG